jgi:four helix bundle protein
MLTPQALRDRTQRFALRIIHFCGALPKSVAIQIIARQLLKAGTGIGANYRAACRSRSDREFVARLAVAEEEADESVYWLEILQYGRLAAGRELEDLLGEAHELTAILSASGRTARQNLETNDSANGGRRRGLRTKRAGKDATRAASTT